MKWITWLLGFALLGACGGGGAPRPAGPTVVTAEWTAGDDAVLEGADAGVPPPR